jgi:hypothetical protein
LRPSSRLPRPRPAPGRSCPTVPGSARTCAGDGVRPRSRPRFRPTASTNPRPRSTSWRDALPAWSLVRSGHVCSFRLLGPATCRRVPRSRGQRKQYGESASRSQWVGQVGEEHRLRTGGSISFPRLPAAVEALDLIKGCSWSSASRPVLQPARPLLPLLWVVSRRSRRQPRRPDGERRPLPVGDHLGGEPLPGAEDG